MTNQHRHLRRWILCWAFLVGLCGVGTLLIADELGERPVVDESWSSFRGDAQLTGVARTRLPEHLKLRWKYVSVDGAPGSAAIVGDAVYQPLLDGALVCLDLKTGEKRWSYASREEVKANSFLPGFKSSPLVTESMVVVGDEEGWLHGIDRATGKGVWTFETGAEIISSPTLVKALEKPAVVVGSYDNCLYCVDLSTGTQNWRVETEGYVNCTAAVAEGVTFVAGCDEKFHVIDLKSGQESGLLPMKTYLIASPAVIGDEVYVGTYTGEVVALNWKTLETRWRYALGDRPYEVHSSAAVTEDLVIVGGQDKNIHAINRHTGERVWVVPTRGHVDSSPVVCGERVYVGSKDGNLYELAVLNGEVLSKNYIGRNVTASAAVGEGALVIGASTSSGEVHCYGD